MLFRSLVPRVLPEKACAAIISDSWERPAIFRWLQAQGNVSDTEMLRTFNCGVGMVLCVPKKDCDVALKTLNRDAENAFYLGDIVERDADSAQVVFR